MRISDWSSDVCSSDLFATPSRPHPRWPDTWQPIQFREYSWRAFLRRKPSLKSLCGQSDISFPWCFCVFEIPKIWYPGLFSKHLQHLLNNLHAGINVFALHDQRWAETNGSFAASGEKCLVFETFFDKFISHGGRGQVEGV